MYPAGTLYLSASSVLTENFSINPNSGTIENDGLLSQLQFGECPKGRPPDITGVSVTGPVQQPRSRLLAGGAFPSEDTAVALTVFRLESLKMSGDCRKSSLAALLRHLRTQPEPTIHSAGLRHLGEGTRCRAPHNERALQQPPQCIPALLRA